MAMMIPPVAIEADALTKESALVVSVDLAICPRPYVARLVGWPHPEYRYDREFVGQRAIVDLTVPTMIVIRVPFGKLREGDPLEIRVSSPVGSKIRAIVNAYLIVSKDPPGFRYVTEADARRAIADRSFGVAQVRERNDAVGPIRRFRSVKVSNGAH